MSVWDAPNQQVVREDESPPWEEGTGGDEGDPTPIGEAEPEPTTDTPADDLDAMTKDQLLEEAERRGVDADPSMTKAEIRDAIGA